MVIPEDNFWEKHMHIPQRYRNTKAFVRIVILALKKIVNAYCYGLSMSLKVHIGNLIPKFMLMVCGSRASGREVGLDEAMRVGSSGWD